jgi:esterase/lipase
LWTNQWKLTMKNYPHVAIIGVRIGGVVSAVACLHRQIVYAFERDSSFDARAQGYGLTLLKRRNENAQRHTDNFLSR